MITRFILRLSLSFGLLSILLTVAGILIGEAESSQEWDIVAFSRCGIGEVKPIYLMDTSQKLAVNLFILGFVYTWITDQKSFLYTSWDYESYYTFDIIARTSTKVNLPDDFQGRADDVDLLWTPDRKHFALSDRSRIFTLDFQNRRLRYLAAFPETDFLPIPTLSPDGKYVALLTPYDIHLLEIETQEIQLLSDESMDDSILRWVWMPDSQKIAFLAGKTSQYGGSQPFNLFTISITDRHVEQLTNNQSLTTRFTDLSVSPGGDFFLIGESREDENTVKIFNLQDNSTKDLKAIEFLHFYTWSVDGKGLVDVTSKEFIYLDIEQDRIHPLFDYQSPYWDNICGFDFLPQGSY